MYIKTVVLDGFKSYGQRTEITGFDEQFNAITGLNGSGKSNILDSICFVLGITNLSQVRASNLQDLIYKSGQAGVNKATVSITFDNRNADQCPPGFENVPEITITRQVVIGGKNKYMINGTIVPNKKVQDLFCSVQLNVNNPHFLIMQGKITKVLNMKPYDILAMIEEAAGTKMYEVKKQAAQKTMEKKDAKLKELNTIVEEEITPKLEKLRNERSKYLEFKTVERELDQMLLLYQAWEYFASQRNTAKAKQMLEKGENQVKAIENKIEENRQGMQQIDQEVEELTQKSKSEGNERLQKAEAELKEKEKAGAKANATVKSLEDSITSEEKKKKQLEKVLKDDTNTLTSKQDELSKVQGVFDKLKNEDLRDNEALAACQKRYEALSAGMELNECGEAETLHEQLMNLKQKSTEGQTRIKQSNMRIGFCQSQLKEKQKALGNSAQDYEGDKRSLDKLMKEVNNLEKSLGKVNYSEERMAELQHRRQTLTQEIRQLDSRVKNFEAQRPYTQFNYDDPEPNFNRDSVLGVVCRLINVKDPAASVAIETAAGGRLYNVVIDTDVTGKKLLQNGNLRQRTTFIPLNKIRGYRMNDSAVRAAEQLVGKENVQPALSHLQYDKRLQVVMEFIFGGVFVCKDINVARQVAFHPNVRCRCVTLDGDVADPAGTLSGGAAKKGESILQQIAGIRQFEDQLSVKSHEIRQINAEAEKMRGSQEQYATMKQQLELKRNEVNLLQQKLQQTTHHQQQEEINQLKTEIEELTRKIEECKANELEYNKKIKELESKIKNSAGRKEDQLKEAETEMKKLKLKADKSRKEWQKREQDYASLNLEIAELKKSLENTQQQIRACEEHILDLQKQLKEAQVVHEEFAETIKALQVEVKKEKSAIAEKNKDIQKKLHKKEELAAQITEFELEIKERSHEIKKLKDDYKNMKAKEHDSEKKIKKDSRFFKDAEKMSDTEGHDLEKRIRRAQETKHKLSRTVNAKAQSMFDQEESQYVDLRKKQKIVEQDKKKIMSVIADLDKKKENTLKLAYEQISKDFGSIFSTLLPGAGAKLIPPTGQTILQGVEVKVSLGGVWKESLTELSGGQRSLAALSLILSMLLFKPAPLYILDEVDAALDLSHTQNIGNMLKSHFKKSQFVIVSLKDGMFNNANVLFRTKFVDGVSTITRSVNRNVF